MDLYNKQLSNRVGRRYRGELGDMNGFLSGEEETVNAHKQIQPAVYCSVVSTNTSAVWEISLGL